MLLFARFLLFLGLSFAFGISQTPQQGGRGQMPSYIPGNVKFLETVALESLGLEKIDPSKGEWLLIVDRHFAWGNTWDQLVVLYQGCKPSLLGYSFDDSDAPLEAQIQNAQSFDPKMTPIQVVKNLKFKRYRLALDSKLPKWFKALPVELEKMKSKPEIKTTDLDAHMAVVRVVKGDEGWWAVRFETQKLEGYEWIDNACIWARNRFEVVK